MLFENQYPVKVIRGSSEVEYYGRIVLATEADTYLQDLLHTIDWKHDEAKLFGKHIITKRKVAWYAEREFSYSYSNTTKKAMLFTPLLEQLKSIVENTAQTSFNSCLLNLYHNGSESMAWHSDNEKELVAQHGIASVTFGAERRFQFRNKQTKETHSIILEHGSLLLMKGACQDNYLHALPPAARVTQPRINLTFRMMKAE